MKKVKLIIALLIAVTTISCAQTKVFTNFYIQKTAPALYLSGTSATIDFYSGDVILQQSSNLLTLSGGNFSLGTNNLYMTGSIGQTGSRLTKGWFTNLEITNIPTINSGVDSLATRAYARSVGGGSGEVLYSDSTTVFATPTQVRQEINDTIEARLSAAEEGVLKTEYDNYTENDDIIDLLSGLGSDIVAMPYMRNKRMFAADVNMVDSRAYWIVMQIKDTTEITGVHWVLSTQGDFTADNYNGFALFSLAGTTYTEITATADDGDVWKTAQYAVGSKAFPTPVTLNPGVYYCFLVYNTSSTIAQPVLFCNDPLASGNFLLGSSGNKIAGYVDGQTAVPSTETAGDVTYHTTIPAIWFY